MFNYYALEGLAKVIKEKSFVRAAKALFITQSALTQRIQNLEQQVGAPLLIRSSDLRPTKLGRNFISHYYKVLELEHVTKNSISNKDTILESIAIPIALNTESLSTWFISAISPALKTNNITLELHIEDQDRTDILLKQGKVIGCVSSISKPPIGCVSTCLGSMKYCCVANAKFIKKYFLKKIEGKNIAEAPGVIYGEYDRLHEDFINTVSKSYKKYTPRLHYVPYPDGMIRFALQELAYAVLPEIAIKQELKEKKLINLFPKKTFNLKLYWHTQELQTNLIKDISKQMITNAQKILK